MARRKTLAESIGGTIEKRKSTEIPDSELFKVPSEETETKAEEKQQEKPAVRELPKVTLRVFLSACGLRQEHLPPFQMYTKKHNLENKHLTIEQWREEHSKFLNTPVE